MNEIVIKLTGHDDPLPPLFVAYSNSLIKIAKGAPLGPILRDVFIELTEVQLDPL